MNRKVRLFVLAIIALGAGGYSIWNWLQQEHEDAWQTATNKAIAAHVAGHDSEAAETLEASLPDAEKWWPQGPHLIETLSWMGTVYRVQNKYSQAEPLLKRVIDLGEQAGAPESLEVGRAKLNLAVIARDETDDVAAARLFTEAADILSKNSAKACGDDFAAYLNLGFLALQRGDYAPAESYLKRALNGYQALYHGGLNASLANTEFGLAEVYRHQGKAADAAPLYEAALKVYGQTEGPGGKDTRNLLSALSLVQQGPGAADRSQALLKRAMGGPGSEAVDGGTLNNLANIAADKEQFVEAEALYRKACAALEASGGPNDLRLAHALANWGVLYRDHEQLDLSKAEPLLQRALDIRKNKLGDEHPDTAQSLSDLALLYFFEKKFSAALLYAGKALPVQEKVYGTDSLVVSTTLNRIGISERDLGQLSEAEAALKRALAIREAKKASDRWIAISMENLASVYALEGQNSKAANLLARAHNEHAGAYGNP